MRKLFFSFLVFSFPLIGHADTLKVKGTTLYITTNTDAQVFSFLLPNGPATQISTGTLTNNDVVGIAISGTTAYVCNGPTAAGNVFSIPLTGGPFTKMSTTNITTCEDIAIDGRTAYVTDEASNIFSLPIAGGAFSQLNTSTVPSAVFVNIAASNGSVYVTNDHDGNVYSLPESGGGFTLRSSSPIPGGSIGSLAIKGDTVFVATGAGDLNAQIYSLPIAGGHFTQVSNNPLTDQQIAQIAILEDTIYITTFERSIYSLSTKGGDFKLVNDDLIPHQFFAAQFAIFSPPTWNAIPTLTAEIIQTSIGQVVVDHLAMSRIRKNGVPRRTDLIAQFDDLNGLEASLANCPAGRPWERNKNKTKSASTPNCPKQKGFYPWVQFFGEYFREKARRNTPAFHAGAGGLVFAVDYDGLELPRNATGTVGAGLAYAYTKVNGEEDSGNAWINQGALTLYGNFEKCHAYLNVILWGGYYHIQNKRKIAVGNFNGACRSTPEGMQFTPHLELGYDYQKRWFTVEPFAMADWVNNWQGSFHEFGAVGFELKQDGKHSSFLRTEAGFRLFETFQFNWGQMIVLEKGSYVYQRAFKTGDITATFILTDGTYSIDTLTTPQNLGLGEFELQFIPNSRKFYANLAYQGAFGSIFQSHTGLFEIGRAF